MSNYVKKCHWLTCQPDELPYGCKLIPKFPYYCVNSIGDVFSCRGRGGLFRNWSKMVANWDHPGTSKSRAYVSLRANGRAFVKRIHHLVLEAFVGPRPRGMEGCHNDGVPCHNNVDNLRWDTHINNMRDRKNHGNGPDGSKNPSAILHESDVIRIRELAANGMMQKSIAPLFGVSKQCIQTVCSRTHWVNI